MRETCTLELDIAETNASDLRIITRTVFRICEESDFENDTNDHGASFQINFSQSETERRRGWTCNDYR